MPAFCPTCALDDYTKEGVADDGTPFATCRGPDHGPEGFTWERWQPAARTTGRPESGLGAELDIWDKLLECIPSGSDYTSYGAVEDSFFARHPREAAQLAERYGHRWREGVRRSTTQYSMSVYLSLRLRELATEGVLDVEWGPAEGPWSYNGIFSYWRRHSDEHVELLTGCVGEQSAEPAERSLPGEADDVARIVAVSSTLPPATEDYTEHDFVMNLMETVLDYQLQTTAVVRALDHYRESRWDQIRTMTDLESAMARFPDDEEGNTTLAQHLWGYNLWTRAQQLRDLTAFFRSIGVVDQPALERWAEQAEFKRDFARKVRGLGPAVFQWLVMRQGIDTVKPDVHVRRFAEGAVGRRLSDLELIDLVEQAAAKMGIPARELDWRIWEASHRG